MHRIFQMRSEISLASAAEAFLLLFLQQTLMLLEAQKELRLEVEEEQEQAWVGIYLLPLR